MLALSLPWWEFVLRSIVVYAFLLICLRIIGKRQFGQLAPFDLILLLILSNAVQNSMNGGDQSLLGGLISAFTLLALDYLTGWITFKSKRASLLIEGKPEVLIHDGHIDKDLVKRERLSKHEIDAAIRKEGCMSINEVEYAVIENDGSISVRKREHKPEMTAH